MRFREERPQRGQRGAALITAVVMILIVQVFVASFLRVSVGSARQTTSHVDISRLNKGAESVIAVAAHRLWNGFLTQNGGAGTSLASFRTYLDGLGVVDLGQFASPSNSDGIDLTQLMSLPEGGATAFGLAGVDLDDLAAIRSDTATNTTLYITATVRTRRGASTNLTPMRRTVQQAYVTEGDEWPGLNFALLGNNVNCIMCHARIDSAERFYNTDPSKFGTFDRIKVGTLESLLLRSSADSQIAGSLYVRGSATDKSGNPITDWPAQTVKTWAFDSDGYIVEDTWGGPSVVDLSPADSADPQPLENLYLDYSLDQATMVDGFLPQEFPSPFPDDGNRIVDGTEFTDATADATGSLSGGSIYLVDPASPIDTPGELTDALSTGNQTSLSSATIGSVVLTGTVDKPIQLNGQIGIDGDVIISGYVVGEGSLLVSGNVYVPSSLIYLDGTVGGDPNAPRTYGNAANGSINNLGIVAGGSILVGDLYYSKKGEIVTGDESGKFSFVMSELALFNRLEWSKTQPALPGIGEDINDPSSWTQNNPYYKGAGYVPRYYVFNETGTIPIYNKGKSSKKPVYFDEATGTWKGKEHAGDWSMTLAYPQDPNDPILYNPDGSPKAAIHKLGGTTGWISDDMLAKMMKDAVTNSPAGQPVEIDAFLYTNNSIFGIVGKSTPMEGKMIVNGAIVAENVGLLVPGNGGVGLNLNFDQRGKSLIKLDLANTEISFRRKLSMTGGVN